MDREEFRKQAHRMVDWMVDYLNDVEKYPVLSQVKPGEIKNSLPEQAPELPESFEAIMHDFEKIILPGITHWESPNFFAYFPATKSEPSILAEMLMATLGTQGMLWLTSPAATELEEKMMEWLKEMMQLPSEFKGVIQDTASSATLAALLTAREKASNWAINQQGFSGLEKFVVYSSDQVHSSIDKAVKIAGFGIENLRKIETDVHYALKPEALRKQIEKDMEDGFHPLCVVSALGTTSSTAIDPIAEIGEIAREFGLWHHVDAAYAGTALILPEFHHLSKGLVNADSFVFNPHKWMFVNFDCSVYFVKNASELIQTFSISPEYLKTNADSEVINYRDWHIQLGRRFRALKLWFVIRSFGLQGLQEKLRTHIAYGKWLEAQISAHPQFEILAPVPLNLVCFRFKPDNEMPEEFVDKLNEELLQSINSTGKIFITHTKLSGKYTLRLVAGSTQTHLSHVEKAWQLIKEKAAEIYRKN